ncbi:MAG: HEAT repeat domain-containing protein [Myxococcales bacterium]|nr:HEAT repeat domain-containing protein [Myxococcales bacterium]
MIAPQHVLRSPAGEEILRVPYRISQPELEWCLVTAIRTVDPDFRWELPEGAQPPKRLVMEGVALGPASPGDPPPDHAEVEELIKTIRAVKKPWTRVEDVRRLMLSPEKKAVEYIGDLLTLLPDKADKLLARHLGDLGRLAPPEYRKVVEEYLDADLAEVRIAAAVALEQIADPKSTKALTRQWKRERDVAVRRELIHAIARCAGDDRAAVKLVSTAAADSDEPDVQVSAVLAAADLSDAAAASEIVRTALASRDPGARRAGAWVAGHVGGGALKDALLEARSVEEDPEARAAMDLACDVLEGAAAQQKLEKLRRDLEPDALDRVR